MQHYYAAKTVLCLDILNGIEDQDDQNTDRVQVRYV